MNNYIRHSTQTGLTDSDVLDMRTRAQRDGTTATSIAETYGIDRTTAGRIITGRTWSHVPAPKQIGKYTNYSIYPDGRVYSKSSGRFIQTTIGKDGIGYVELRTGGERAKFVVAELVAKAFLGTKSKKISFANGDGADAHFTNLVVNK